MKKGFTVVELIVSFSLTIVIAILLFQLIINLKRLYDNSILKTELVNIQSIVSREINDKFLNNKIIDIDFCGNNCWRFVYEDNSSDELKIDNENEKIEFGNYTTKLDNGSYIKDFSVNVSNSGNFSSSANNSNLLINISLTNDSFKNQTIDINVVYQFNDEVTNLFVFDYNNEYIQDGLILHYDGYVSPNNGVWKDVSGNGNDGIISGFDETSWKEKYISFDGIDDVVFSEKNLGLSGDAEFTMCAVASWNGSSWSTDWPSYMGINSFGNNVGLSMSIKDGQPALDFWNLRYRANNALNVQQIYQICLTKQSGSINDTSKIYINGELVAGTGNSTGSPNIMDAKAVVGRLDANRWTNANIYNVMYYDRALSEQEIKQNFQIDEKRFINMYTSYSLTNIVKNGGFESNSDWELYDVSYVTNQKYSGNYSLKLSPNVTAMSIQRTSYKPIYGHKYYGRLMFKSSDNFSTSDSRYELFYTDAPGALLTVTQKNISTTDWKLLSNIISLPNDNYINEIWYFRNFEVNSNSESYVDDLLFIDLTEAFGAGNEPSKEWCDENIPFFEGQYNLLVSK